MCNTYQIAFSRPLFTGSLLFNHVVIGNVGFDFVIKPPAIHFLYEKKNCVLISPWCALQGMFSYLD